MIRVQIWYHDGPGTYTNGDEVHHGVEDTATSGDFFCVYLPDGITYKYPISLIRKVRECEEEDND